MSKFEEHILKKDKKFIKLLGLCLILAGVVCLYTYITSFYVVIRFGELGALTKNMPVYYNGFKIGKVTDIDPDVDFKHTIVKVVIFKKNINLPQNTTAKVENFPSGELYLQFVYPKSPSLRTIKRGDLLEGIAPYSPEQFMLGQNISGVTDIVSIHVIQALKATEIANMEITNFFKNSSKLVNENSKQINASVNNTLQMTKNLEQMSQNLKQASKKLSDAIDEKALKDATYNVKDATANISNATKDIDKTMKKIDDTVSEANAAAKNLNSITSGINETLCKRFAGMRVMFGKPVKSKKCCNRCCE